MTRTRPPDILPILCQQGQNLEKLVPVFWFCAADVVDLSPYCNGPKVSHLFNSPGTIFLDSIKRTMQTKKVHFLLYLEGKHQELMLQRPECLTQGSWEHKSGLPLGGREKPTGGKKASRPKKKVIVTLWVWLKMIGG